MGAHIFLVGEENFDVCIERGVYGCVMPSKEWNRGEIVSGILSIQTGDLVFFYVKNKGVYGLWKVIGERYFDETRIWPSKEQTFPYRFSFEAAVGQFEKPISLNDVLDLHDKGRIWTFDLNPVQQKNQNKITMDEARELIRLLLRNNPIRVVPSPIKNPYKSKTTTKIDIDFSSREGNRLRYESWLNAWFIRALSRGELKELLGDYREFINLVPTSFNKVMDIFLTHVTQVDGMEVLHKYTCLELKSDKADEQDLTQVLRYEDWLARKLATGDHEMVQSILVATRFSEGVLEYVANRRRIEKKVVRLITYRIAEENIVLMEHLPTP